MFKRLLYRATENWALAPSEVVAKKLEGRVRASLTAATRDLTRLVATTKESQSAA